MTDLTKLANGQPCLVRVIGVCNFNRATTIAAHWRLIGISGMSLKVPDLMVAFCCNACHDFVDNLSFPHATQEQRDLALAHGIFRTQNWLIKHGYVEW